MIWLIYSNRALLYFTEEFEQEKQEYFKFIILIKLKL
jgi:hypothetical protein